MKKRNGNTNTAGVSFTDAVLDENPYLKRTLDEPDSQQQVEDEIFDGAEQGEEGLVIDLVDEAKKAKRRRHRLAFAAVAVLLLMSIVGGLTLYFRGSTRVEYGPVAKQPQIVPPAPKAVATAGQDPRTEQAIEEAQRLTTTNEQAQVKPPSKSTDAASTVTGKPDNPFSVPPDFAATVRTKHDPLEPEAKTKSNGFNARNSDTTTAPATASSVTSDTKMVRSQRNTESSFYTTEQVQLRNQPTVLGAQPGNGKLSGIENRTPTAVLPSFGSILPVRTIGGLYTLRSGALTRLEVTRDMEGDGWSMKRGTVIVGTSKGGEKDRAFVSIVGFIDPQSGKLVKLGGDVLGGDGGAGLKGKRRQLDSSWSRLLGKVGTAALNVTGAFIGGRGNGTVIVSDALRTSAVNPLTDEISGVMGGELNQKQRTAFVEVEAGTFGYVMVTDLPAALNGTEPTPALNDETLAALSDIDAARPATGLSERELADLLAGGTPEQIRAAMPRMTPEMRKIAVAVLGR